jgi:hypothetical protein
MARDPSTVRSELSTPFSAVALPIEDPMGQEIHIPEPVCFVCTVVKLECIVSDLFFGWNQDSVRRVRDGRR